MNLIKHVAAAAIVAASAAPALAATKEAPAPIALPAPPPGKGQIVFFRASAMGFAVGAISSWSPIRGGTNFR